MENKKLLVITYNDSDLLRIFKKQNVEVTVVKPNEVALTNLDMYYSIAILGGGKDSPLLLNPKDRNALEEQINKGKKVFAEYLASVGNVYFNEPENTRYDRLVYCSEQGDIPNIQVGALIDDQSGLRLRPHDIACNKNTPVLQYIKINTHAHVELDNEISADTTDRALWFEEPENLLVCSFQLSSFKKARFAPWKEAEKIIGFIIGWLLDEDADLTDNKPIYSTSNYFLDESLENQIKKSINHSMNWFNDAQIILNEGESGAIEGLGTEIYPNGDQRISNILRADCIGENALPYFLDYMLTGNKQSLVRSDNLLDFLFDNYICQEQNEFFGMMRWTNEAWGVCYQDDVARAIIPQLLKCYYLNTDKHLNNCIDVLKFLIKTTGTDGTRVFRTDNIDLNEKTMKELQENPGNLPSAHYNAYYHASLLLAYKLTGIKDFRYVAVKGLTTIMNEYPNTTREQSETQENCRLILPLSWLYWITGESVHKEWLYKVTNELEKMKHDSGGYIEWDTGYQASMRNEKGEEESSLLTENGDPVADLLYSNNWLPIAFMQAYLITDDEKFKHLWEEVVNFFIDTQIRSKNKQINGSWARAFDVSRKEVYGTPADQGWGPWAIESGWTVAEVTSGMFMGLLEKDLKVHYKNDKYHY